MPSQAEWLRHFDDMAVACKREIAKAVFRWTAPVIIDKPAWRDYVRAELAARGFTRMAADCEVPNLALHAYYLAYEVLADEFSTPDFCLASLLPDEARLVFWRAIVIYKYARSNNA